MSLPSLAPKFRQHFAALALACAILPATAVPIPDPLGTPVPAAAAMREIKISKSTKYVNVARNEIVRFLNGDGTSFTWHFYTLHHPTIPMLTIAPAGFVQQEVLIYVGSGPDEVNG